MIHKQNCHMERHLLRMIVLFLFRIRIFGMFLMCSLYPGLSEISDYLCMIFGLHGAVSMQQHTLAQKIRYFASRTIPSVSMYGATPPTTPLPRIN